jgi:hypothetical protein
MENAALTFNILIKREGQMCVAHCLELDIVATGNSMADAQKDIIDLILTQVEYAFSNDNLDYLYRPAPAEIWKEFYACRDSIQDRFSTQPEIKNAPGAYSFIPPWIIANTCKAAEFCHA